MKAKWNRKKRHSSHLNRCVLEAWEKWELLRATPHAIYWTVADATGDMDAGNWSEDASVLGVTPTNTSADAFYATMDDTGTIDVGAVNRNGTTMQHEGMNF